VEFALSRQVRVKICGLRSEVSAYHAAAAGADAIGLVFYAKSPRHLPDLGLAEAIARAAGPFISVVGLFVDADAKYVDQVLKHVPLSCLQFHGQESNADCRQFERPFYKALRMKPDVDISETIGAYPDALGILLDAYHPERPGGTGDTFDWQRIPENRPQPLILAGGLNGDNVALAVKSVKPWAVDVSGGVELAPGMKDDDLVRKFILRAKAVALID
jgi:phosphoribosylanthranilate isomerase